MSEHITHVAVCEDCIRLAVRSEKICQPFKTVLSNHADIARLGSFTRSGDRFTVEVLDYCRDRWAGRQSGGKVEEKLAFVLGWRCHNAADRQFKPVYEQLEPESTQAEAGADEEKKPPGDTRIYHDAIVFREVYRGGKDKPFSPHLLEYRMQTHPAAGAVAVEKVEALFGGLLQRSLFSLHKSLARQTDQKRRLFLAADWFQPFTVDIHRMSRAFYSPDPGKLQRFLIDNNFYDRSDPLIALARSIQRGAPDNRIQPEEAVQAAETQSGYAQALRKGYGYLVASSEYFERKIGERELRERLDLFEPHDSTSRRPLG